MKKREAYKTIGEAAKSLNIAPHVLRFWENEFKHIGPKRINNRRYYDTNTLNQLAHIKSLLYDKGYTINGAKSLLDNKQNQHNESHAQIFTITQSVNNLRQISEEFKTMIAKCNQ